MTAISEPRPTIRPPRRRRPTLIAVSPRVRWAFVLLGLIVLVLLIRAAPSVLSMTLGGFTLSLVLSFPVRLLERFMPRRMAILVTFLALVGLITLVVVAIVPTLIEQLTALIAATPSLATEGDQLLRDLLRPLQERGWLTSTPDDLIGQAQQELISRAQVFAQQFLTLLLSWVTGAINVVLTIFGIVFVAVYLLSDARKLKATYLLVAPKRYRADAAELWADFGQSLSRYVAGLFVIILVQGAVSTVALTILQIPYAAVLGAWVSATAILPFIGAWLGAIPAILIAAFISPTRALLVLGAYLLIQQLEGNVLTPRIQGQALRAHAILVFMAVIAGSEIAGLSGALFAVPTLAVLRVLFDFLRHRLRVVDPLPVPAQPAVWVPRRVVVEPPPVVTSEVVPQAQEPMLR
ncbi:MAG TPA: AI-2E family transporter [Thermomicrobiales bacterium]